MTGLTLDAGALIALERNDRRVTLIISGALMKQSPIAIPAGVVAQVWRDGRSQVRIARLLSSTHVEVEPLDHVRARAAGQLCGRAGTSDVVDASVVLCARHRGHIILTSDEADLRRLDPTVRIEAI